MNLPVQITADTLPEMVRAAARTLDAATSSAEVLEARNQAAAVYDAAKRAERLARAKQAYDDLHGRLLRVQGEALAIESRAKIRLADEYDAAQARGEVASTGDTLRRGTGVPEQNAGKAVAADIGITRKEVHEARRLRDGEKETPGIVDDVIEREIEEGRAPTRAAVNRAVAKPKRSISAEQSNKQFYRIVKAWDDAGEAARRRFREHIAGQGEP